MIRSWALPLSCAALLAVGCTDRLPATEVIAVIDAEPRLRADIARLELTVRGGSDEDHWQERFHRDFSVEDDDLQWPFPATIVPRGDDDQRLFEVLGEAFDEDGLIGRVRAITGFAQGKTLYLSMAFSLDCRGVLCGTGETCRGGACVDAHTDVEDLPLVSPPGVVDPDAGSDAGPVPGDAAQCDPSSCPTPASVCLRSACVDGGCGTEPSDVGQECDEDGGRRCDESGHCSACQTGNDEACGGADLCPRCEAGAACGNDEDCGEGADCLNGVCQPPSCIDKTTNGTETDFNCGGLCAANCARGQGCAVNEDCEDGTCRGGFCCGVPCGRCEQCAAVTGACTVVPAGQDPDGQCPGKGNHCDGAGACVQCVNATLDEAEADVDCGGLACDPCDEGDQCIMDLDCKSGLCIESRCERARCGDGKRSGLESDVDCGGPCGATCGDGQSCGVKSDCASFSCVSGECEGP